MTRSGVPDTGRRPAPLARGRRAFSRGGARAVAVLVLAAALASAGCSARRGAEREAREAFERGDYREAVAVCRHAKRRGIESPRLEWIWGASLLSLGRDTEAWTRLEAAVRMDPALAGRAGRTLFDAGRADANAGRRRRAAERIARAIAIDPTIDPGSWAYLLGDHAWTRDRYDEAARWYRAALDVQPDTAVAETAWYRLAVALEKTGRTHDALEAYETLLERWPRTRHRASVRWRVATLIYDEAQAAFDAGDAEGALERLEALPEYTTNRTMLQKQRFLEGQAWEMLGDFERAWNAYHAVIESDLGASGAIVRRAREKLDALREAGFH